MSTGLSSPLGVMGIIFIIIGIIMVVIGIILLIANQSKDRPWYVWLLLVMGVIIGIVGGIILAITLSSAVDTVPIVKPVYSRQMNGTYPLQTGRADGDETFDPYPQTIITKQRPPPVETVLQGPYGPGGAQAAVPGIYTGPTKTVYVSRDIPEHKVQIRHS